MHKFPSLCYNYFSYFAVGEEKTEFDVVCKKMLQDNKIKVIIEIQKLLGLSLRQSKDVVDSFPKTIFFGIDRDRTTEVKARLEAVGIQIEIK